MDLDQSADCYVSSDLSLVILSASPEMNLAGNFGPISTAKLASVYECIPFIWPYNARSALLPERIPHGAIPIPALPALVS
jgi:hypothetical protein